MPIKKMSHQERMQRQAAKRAAILDTCRRMGWIDVATASQRLELTPDAARLTLRGMVRDGLLLGQTVEGVAPRPVAWYRATARGMAEAYILAEDDIPDPLPEGRGRIACQNYRHEQDILRVAIDAERAAGARFRMFEPPPNGQKKVPTAQKYPDGLIVLAGKTYALEVEREAKSQRRYREIISAHLMAVERGLYDRIIYLSPDNHTKNRVKKMILSVKTIHFGGRVYNISQKDLTKFVFGTYKSFEKFIRKQLSEAHNDGFQQNNQ